ncbi:MAG: hypothetical protein IIA73_11160 [Proteobacteria bacterium]|nr:hypothetical protein [Pseudomonadota bacterium]
MGQENRELVTPSKWRFIERVLGVVENFFGPVGIRLFALTVFFVFMQILIDRYGEREGTFSQLAGWAFFVAMIGCLVAGVIVVVQRGIKLDRVSKETKQDDLPIENSSPCGPNNSNP